MIITAEHLQRIACVYIRQSTADQLVHNLESQRRQYGDRQIVGQLAGTARLSPTLWPGGRRRGQFGSGLFFGLRLLQVLDPELELLDKELAALRRLSETLMPRLGELKLQPLDLQGAGLGFASRGGKHLALSQDHRMRVRQIARKSVSRMFGSACHAADLSRFEEKNRPQSGRMSQSAAVIQLRSGRQVCCGIRQSMPERR